VPLYWTLTFAQSLYVIGTARHDAAEHGIFGIVPLVKSLLFIPYENAQGRPRPILAQGWTLNFEIGFYAIFAVCLALPRKVGLVAAMLALALLAFAPALGLHGSPLMLLADPIVLYFACGIALASLRRWMMARGGLPRIPYPLAGCGVLILLFLLLDNLAPSPAWHWLCAIGVVSLAVLAADMPGLGRVGTTAVMLGNISYALYLSHGFVLETARIVWRRAFDWGQPGLYLLLVPVVAVAGAYLCYRWVERPLDARFRRHRLARQRANP
jgi:exopolysaccharide production protein ExoZ